jgi:hypothetical protein
MLDTCEVVFKTSTGSCCCEMSFVNTLHWLTQVSKEFFPAVALGFQDPRVNVHIGDGTSVQVM